MRVFYCCFMFIILISDKRDPHQRYWVKRDTFADAQIVAREYERTNDNLVEIYQSEQVF